MVLLLKEKLLHMKLPGDPCVVMNFPIVYIHKVGYEFAQPQQILLSWNLCLKNILERAWRCMLVIPACETGAEDISSYNEITNLKQKWNRNKHIQYSKGTNRFWAVGFPFGVCVAIYNRISITTLEEYTENKQNMTGQRCWTWGWGFDVKICDSLTEYYVPNYSILF